MKNVGLRITDEEYERLSAIAENSGMTRAGFLHKRIGDMLFTPLPQEEGIKILQELRRIANILQEKEKKSGGEGDPSRLLYHEHYCQLLKEIREIKELLQRPAKAGSE